MKSAYELAMERLSKSSPTVKLSDTQKKALAELDSRYTAKIAEREIALRSQIDQLSARGESDQAAELEKQLVHERQSLLSELEAKKEQIRKSGGKN